MTNVNLSTSAKSAEFITNELAIRAWCDTKFQADLEADQTDVVRKLCEEFGIAYDSVAFANILVPGSPAGDLPFDGYKATGPGPGGGAWLSLTAECGCDVSETGGCSCLSIAGTPCITCQI